MDGYGDHGRTPPLPLRGVRPDGSNDSAKDVVAVGGHGLLRDQGPVEELMGKMVWCIRHKDGYCASKTPSTMPEEADSLPTLCDHFITLPTGIRRGMPTCGECLKILFEGA